MFTKIGPNEVTNDQGFKIKIGRGFLTYFERNKSIGLNAEYGQGPDLIIQTSSIRKWHPPFDNEPVSSNKKAEIIARIEEALSFLQVKYRLI